MFFAKEVNQDKVKDKCNYHGNYDGRDGDAPLAS